MEGLYYDTPSLAAVATGEMMSVTDYKHLWTLIVGFGLAFLLGFGMGANDVANAFGTSVGSRVLSLRMAYMLASIFELLGAMLVGYNVTDTMRKSVVDLQVYSDTPYELLLGEVAVLAGCSSWMILATALRTPVSTTHSIVGATLGFTLLARGTRGIHWAKVGQIAVSWVLSPVLSGLVSGALYMVVDFAVLRRSEPVKCGLRSLPPFYFVCIAFNTFAVSYQGSKLLHLDHIPLWASALIAFAAGLLAALVVHFFMRARLLHWINTLSGNNSNNGDHVADDTSAAAAGTVMKLSVISTRGGTSSLEEDAERNFPSATENAPPPPPYGGYIQPSSYDGPISVSGNRVGEQGPKKNKRKNVRKQEFKSTPSGLVKWFLPAREREEDKPTLKLFSSIQVFTACFAGFAHGANDVSNAIAPLTAMLSIYANASVEQEGQTPLYMLAYGVLAICVGLWLLGHRVIKTVGQRMSDINPASGFAIEFGAAVTVLAASKLGLPVSTTHCLVGSVVAVGTLKSGDGIDWRIFGGVALSWVVTLPASAVIAAVIMWILSSTML